MKHFASCYVKMDGHKCIEEAKAHFCSFPSRNDTKKGRVYVYCWCLVLL